MQIEIKCDLQSPKRGERDAANIVSGFHKMSSELDCQQGSFWLVQHDLSFQFTIGKIDHKHLKLLDLSDLLSQFIHFDTGKSSWGAVNRPI